jgi:hypothetical protein
MTCKTAFVGGKRTGAALPSLASHAAPFRRETTAWAALVWAYADEIVRAASSVGGSNFPAPGLAMSGLGRERISGGLINGFYEPHGDARLIHQKLTDWFAHDPRAGFVVMSHAEKRHELQPRIEIPRVMVLPVLDRNGNVLVQRHRSHRKAKVITEYCLVDYEGTDPRIAEQRERAWSELYQMFTAFLDVMPGFPLTKWKVTSRGLTKGGESLTR